MALRPIDFYDCERFGMDDARPFMQRERKSVNLIKRQLANTATARILDVGCGNGFFLQELDKALNRDYEYHGVDYSEYKIDKAGALPYGFSQCNLEEGIPHPDASFDVVYCGEVIEHVYNPDFVVEECRRIIKPDGLFVLSTPNLQAWYNRFLFVFGIQPIFYEVSTRDSNIGVGILRRFKGQNVPVGHVRVFNRRGILDLLRSQGFEPVTVTGAVFEALPGPALWIDNAFNVRPSLASNLVIASRPKPAH